MPDDLTMILDTLKATGAGQLAMLCAVLIGYVERRWRKPWLAHIEREKIVAVRVELLAERAGISDDDVAARLARGRVNAARVRAAPPVAENGHGHEVAA